MTKEYLGTIENMSMNLTHAAVMFDGKLLLHQVSLIKSFVIICIDIKS